MQYWSKIAGLHAESIPNKQCLLVLISASCKYCTHIQKTAQYCMGLSSIELMHLLCFMQAAHFIGNIMPSGRLAPPMLCICLVCNTDTLCSLIGASLSESPIDSPLFHAASWICLYYYFIWPYVIPYCTPYVLNVRTSTPTTAILKSSINTSV